MLWEPIAAVAAACATVAAALHPTAAQRSPRARTSTQELHGQAAAWVHSGDLEGDLSSHGLRFEHCSWDCPACVNIVRTVLWTYM